MEHEFYFFPFGNNKTLLPYLGLGGYVGHSKQYGYPEEHYDPATGDFTYDLRPIRGYQAGYLISLNFDAQLDDTQRWLLGSKLSFQNDTFGNTLLALQLKVGYRF